MSWRERLAVQRTVTDPKRPDGELTKPTKGAFVSFGSEQTGPFPTGELLDLCTRLLHLAEAEAVDAAHVHHLHADDVAACAGLDDEGLRRYLMRLEQDADMNAGLVPAGWDAVGHCAGCGPIHLWEPLQVIACPWCLRRKSGKRIPRPLVPCGGCIHYQPDPLNPEAGMGVCALGAGRAYWPMRWHSCADMAPENDERLALNQMISESVAVAP